MTRLVALALLLTSCVTRVQVCVQAEHARPPRGSYDRPSYDTVGGSVCADVERR